MNLVSLAARLIFVNLVKDRTIARHHVLNAPIEPVDQVSRLQEPVVAVYTGVVKNKSPAGRNLLSVDREGRLELVYQTYLPPTDIAVEGFDQLNIQGAGAGAAMDLFGRQIVAALQMHEGPWAKLWTDLVVGYDDFDSRPVLIEIEGGVKIPCREVSLTCRTVSDPGLGMNTQGFWADLDTEMRKHPDMVATADLIKAAIDKPAGMPDWKVIMANNAFSEVAMLANGLRPIAPPLDGGEPPVMSGFTIDPADLRVVAHQGDFTEEP